MTTGLRSTKPSRAAATEFALHAILVAELADNDAWEELVSLAQEMGQDEMAAQFEEARDAEREHLATVRKWHQEDTLNEAKTGT